MGSGERPVQRQGAIVFADDLTPSRFLSTDWGGGAIVLANGSPTSHVAILARGRGVPMVVGVAGNGSLGGPAEAIVDGARGVVLVGPDARDLDEYRSLGQHAADAAALGRRADLLHRAGGGPADLRAQ